MEISEDKLADIKDASYIEGCRSTLLGQMRHILNGLSITDDVTRERLIMEREEAISALRSICAEHGDNDWDDTLYLPDIINKHLGRHLTDSKYHK